MIGIYSKNVSDFFFTFRKYDLIIGGIHSDRIKSVAFEPTVPYIQDDLTWCVSRANQIPRWMNVFYIPKDAQTYLSGILLLILTLFAAYFLTTFEEKPLDFLYCIILTVQTIIAFPSIFNPKGLLLRLHYALFLIIPFWLTQIYSAYLFTFISQVIFEHQIATCSEISDQNFRLTGDHHVIDHLGVKNAVKYLILNLFSSI